MKARIFVFAIFFIIISSLLNANSSVNAGDYDSIRQSVKSRQGMSMLKTLLKMRNKATPIVNGAIKALDDDDVFKWVVDTDGGVFFKPGIGDDGTLYVVGSGVEEVSGNVVNGDIIAINPDTGKTKWEFNVNSEITGTPVIASDKSVFLTKLAGTNSKSALLAISDSGTQLWNFEVDGSMKSPPILSGNKLIIGEGTNVTNSGKLYSFNTDSVNPNNVTPEWIFETEGLFELSPLKDSGLIIAVAVNKFSDSINSTIFAFEEKEMVNGGSVSPKWTFNTIGSIEAQLVIKDDKIYALVDTVGAEEVKVLSIDLNGNQVWEFLIEGIIFVEPVVDSNGTVFISTSIISDEGTGETQLIAINSDGTKKWEFNDVKNSTFIELIFSPPITDADGNLFLGTAGIGIGGIVGNLYSIDTQAGNQNWVKKLEGAVVADFLLGKGDIVNVGLSKATSFDIDTVKFEGLSGTVVFVDKESGTIKDSLETKGAIVAPLTLTEEALFAGTVNQIDSKISGSMYTVIAEGAPLAGSISGIITDSETGDAVSRADVFASSPNIGEGSDISAFDGSYVVGGLPVGLYSLKVEAKGFASEEVEGVDVVLGKSAVRNFSLTPTTDKGSIEGKVSDSITNEGIEDATVSTGEGIFSTQTDKDGDYELNDLPEGVYTVDVVAEGFDPTSVELTAVFIRNTTLLDINLSPVLPIAEFDATPQSGPVPLTVTFNDESIGNITEWLWVFGDGGLSSEQNSEHTYNQAGIYNVTLTVTSSGGSNSTIKPNLVEVFGAPVAEFKANALSGFAPFDVDFTDLSTGNVSTVLWDFGDGNSSTDQNPLHTYETEGLFTVNLEVSGAGGTNATTKTNYIKILPTTSPHAGFSAIFSTGFNPLAVHFNNLSSGQINSRLWDFGDGETSTEQSPVHVYTSDGTFDVTLSIEGDGGSDVVTKNDFIRVLPTGEPNAEFTVDKSVAFAPLDVQFTDLSLGAGINKWLWDFGDGSISPEQSPSHDFNLEGFYSPTLTVTGSGGTVSERKTNLIIAISKGNPIAAFQATPQVFFAPSEVKFTDLSEGDGISSRVWNFGDGGVSTEQNPTHTYNMPGHYTVSLTVSNAEGSSRETKTNLINPVQEGFPLSEFSASPLTGTPPLEVQFNELAEPADKIANYFWSFGDGSFSSEKNPVHTYNRLGFFKVSLIVSNSEGANTNEKQNLIRVIRPLPPIAEFEADKTTGLNPLEVQFTDLSGGKIDSWVWLFGDGGTSLKQNPLHKYARSGIFFVSLTVSGPGGIDTKTVNNLITVNTPAPNANFSATPTIVPKRTEVQFTDLSEGIVNSWVWNFGDGTTSEEQNPKHAYSRKGQYTITLTISGPGGTDVETKTSFISVERKKRRG